MSFTTIEYPTYRLIDIVQHFFKYETKSRYGNAGLSLDITEEDHTLNFTFKDLKENKHTLSIPVPFLEQGVCFIKTNNTKRPVGSFYLMDEDKEVSYLDLIYALFCESSDSNTITKMFSRYGAFIKKIIKSFQYENTSIIVNGMQRVINDITTRMPIHETMMNSWAMNQRVWILDAEFDAIADPKEKLEYQIQKSRKFFHKGWTTIGLADSVLADKNYILKTSLRKTIPFGLYFHNPQRNLYSTLGMKGDETPLIQSETMVRLQAEGIMRKGWNFFTALVDVPDNWEDQIMIDTSLCNKYIDNTKTYQCFNEIQVHEGQLLKKNSILSVNKDKEPVKVKLDADKMWVHEIRKQNENIGGVLTEIYYVTVMYRRFIKEGTKITNLAANKGVVRVKDLGYAIDPRTGEKRKIEVLVSCKSEQKRKNHTQSLEAMVNNINGEVPKVYADDINFTMDTLKARLKETGFPEDGCWDIQLYTGVARGICGTIFWGVIKDVEDMIWDKEETVATDNRGVRRAGLKFSTVEMRALQTRFGKNNPILEEILQYAQGTDDIKELLTVLYSKIGVETKQVPTVEMEKIKPIDQSEGILMEKSIIEGTVADSEFQSNGFMLKLPFEYQIDFNHKGEIFREGIPLTTDGHEGIAYSQKIDKIYVPSADLRRCWKHAIGKYGLSEMGSYLNTIINLSHRYLNEVDNRNLYYMISNAIYRYFSRVSGMLGTKRGQISTYGMSVRYPHSFKGVATLSNELPKNTVEIHRDVAKQHNIHNGDIILIERFPCMGFMSVRPQQVWVTDDPMCKYTIRVSGNCLTSMGLDFDGDVIYGAVLRSKVSRDLLKKEWTNPNSTCYTAIQELNKKAGKPHFKQLTLDDYDIKPLEPLTEDAHATIVAKATGVKANTGPVVALAYNIMRIVENSELKDNRQINVAVEYFLDKVGNSVFKEKHGIKSLHEIVVDAICIADVETLVKEGFKRGTSTTICNLIKQKAKEIGVNDLVTYHEKARSTVINRIVRKQNKVYFCSRSQLEGLDVLKHLSEEAVDIPSTILKRQLGVLN